MNFLLKQIWYKLKIIKFIKCLYFIVFVFSINNNCLSQMNIYKGVNNKIEEKITLNFKDSTYAYLKNLDNDLYGNILTSNGKFKICGDTLILISKMPKNDLLPGHIHNLTISEINKNKFSYIFPTNEIVEKGYVKIYFDNIAKPENYKAYTLKKINCSL